MIFFDSSGKNESNATMRFREQYSGSIRLSDEKNSHPVYDLHPHMESVVYSGMDWLCPGGYNKVLSDRLTLHHGNITIEDTISDKVAFKQTKNVLVAICDLTNSIIHVSNARGRGESGSGFVYERAYSQHDAELTRKRASVCFLPTPNR
jgi:isopenicillin-N N-acyltransferase-like protein